MKKLFAASLVLVLALVAGSSAASAQQERRGDPFEILVAKKADGKYKEYLKTNLASGDKHTYFWKVENTHGSDLDLTFDDAATSDGAPNGYRITWFKGKKQKKDISHDVQTSGYGYTIKDGKTKYFNATVKALASPASNFCVGGQTGSASLPFYDGAYLGVNGECI